MGVYLFVGPSVLAALTVSLPKAAVVAVLLVAYQEVESRVLVQRIYGATLRLPAVAVALSLIIGAYLLGIVGALLALPAAAALRVIVEYADGVRTGRIAPASAPAAPQLPRRDGRSPADGGQQVP